MTARRGGTCGYDPIGGDAADIDGGDNRRVCRAGGNDADADCLPVCYIAAGNSVAAAGATADMKTGGCWPADGNRRERINSGDRNRSREGLCAQRGIGDVGEAERIGCGVRSTGVVTGAGAETVADGSRTCCGYR